MNGYKFRVVVNNSAGSATSNAATLTINSVGPPSALRFFAGTGTGGTHPFSLIELKTNPVEEVAVISNAGYLLSLDVGPDGQMYGAGGGYSLYRIDPSSSTVTTIGGIHSATKPSISMRSIAFSPEGILYAVDDTYLYTIDLKGVST